MNSNTIKQNWHFVLIAILAIALVASLAWGMGKNNNSNEFGPNNPRNFSRQETKDHLEEHGITPLDSSQASNSQTTADELTYLIEEEKLAHDVYQAMYDKWGSRVFGNIKESETTHQDMVLAVMESRGIADPKISEPGKFANQDLQALYDKLIDQGMQSQTEAYKVGVIIEETDIADLKDSLAKIDAKDTDVKDVLENLLHGSENHLRAFNRQLSR